MDGINAVGDEERQKVPVLFFSPSFPVLFFSSFFFFSHKWRRGMVNNTSVISREGFNVKLGSPGSARDRGANSVRENCTARVFDL